MRKIVTAFAGLLLCSALTYGQSRLITGQVKDDKGNPVPYATVKLKGSSRGVSADQNGNFKIEAGNSKALVASATGFAQSEIVIGSESTVVIALKAGDEQLNEVVVTAMGIRRTKNSLPYAAQQVNGDEVSKTRSANFIGGMSGKVSGVEIKQNNTLGGSTNVVIRGAKSLVGNNQALFVVDGVPIDNSNNNTSDQKTGRGGYDYGNAAADVNPDDIESINVLKGAAASALYGSRAANGVVMITTKKGKRGLGVTINSGVTVSSIDKSTFAKYQHSYGANYGSANGYGSPDGNFFYFDANGDGTPDLVTPTTEDASWGAKFDPSLMVYQWDAFDASSPNYGKATPWVAGANDPTTFFEKPVNFNNSIYIDGGGDKGSFKLGYTKNNDKGVLPNSFVNKDLVNFGATYNLTSKLSAFASVNFSKISGQGRYGTGYSGDHSTNLMTNFRQWWQTNVDVKEQKAAYDRTGKNVTWNVADPSDPVNGLVPIFWNNPYWVRYKNYETDSRSRYFGNMGLTYKITDWLDVLGRVSLDSYNETEEERVAVGSLEVPYYSKFLRSFREYNYDLMANFNKDIAKDLNLKATVGLNIRRDQVSSTFNSTNGGLSVPDIYALNNTKNPSLPAVENDYQIGVDGLFASATLGYRDMLFLDLTGRRDKSSTLPVDNNTYYYPSASLGFVFSKLIDNAPWLSYGKARLNYAEVGNSADPKALIDYYSINPAFGNTAMTSIGANNSISSLNPALVTKNNPNLVPEKTKSIEGGVEMSFFKNRLGFDVTYYSTKTVNQIVPAPISRATGFDAKYINVGEIDNHGLEVSLNGTPIKTKDFSWNIALNWTRNRNKVVSLGEGITNFQLGSFQGGVTLNAALGEPYGTIRGQNFVYQNGQKLVSSKGYYVKSPNSNDVIGNVNPDWIGGINNTFKYKNFALTFLIDIRHGGDIFSLDMYYGLATGLYPETAGTNDLGKPVRNKLSDGGGVVFPGITADGKANATRVNGSILDDNGQEQSLFGMYGYYRNPAAAFIYDASYIKLRDLTLTYSFPDKMMQSTKVFKGIDVSLFGRNLWIIHKNLPYSDPEEGISSGNLQGYQVGAYPSTRVIGLNLKLKF
ncbi:SusC/RagA family TonB-linked outer membrane protein [Pinibacter aurantiacus]|uniref:SusC/RagA family TonB-linked outer membrane protein n=1 Tax=Pinibacter aurantiacus TaxID=2851599 RepID=A0A9E2W4T9_9BACT|nr:SusC/RagA family TonB-linked outer membrane protein [Pinibacter aurantiacus]MBV4358174.1 SusC/RagA family TonB-linked outer membrane protein [Pinibacter aurantiacus]